LKWSGAIPDLPDGTLTLVRERAQRRSLTLHKDVDGGVAQIQGDERKIRQVVLNLSNAIKFTPEGGRIEVGAVPKDGFVEVSISDTGIGIAPEDQDAVFEEFRQVGTADKKAEGTGLGADPVPQVHRTPRREDLGEESAGCGLDIHLHDPGTSRPVSADPTVSAKEPVPVQGLCAGPVNPALEESVRSASPPAATS